MKFAEPRTWSSLVPAVGGGYPGDVILWKFPTRGICSDDVFIEACDFLSVFVSRDSQNLSSYTYRYVYVELEPPYVLVLI